MYYTDAINTDSWLMENPWTNEINEENPYGYTIEINAATARAKGFASGDKVRLVTVDGVSVEGVLATSEGVHSECVAVIGGHWGFEIGLYAHCEGQGRSRCASGSRSDP